MKIACKHIYNPTMQFSSIYYIISRLILEYIMKIIKTVMEIVYTKYMFLYITSRQRKLVERS
jgi:hypothetical protein